MSATPIAGFTAARTAVGHGGALARGRDAPEPADAAVSADAGDGGTGGDGGDATLIASLRTPGLTQRTVLLLLAVVFASLAIVAVGFELQRRADQADFVDARARGVAALVHTARTMLLSVPAEERERLSSGLMWSGTLQVFARANVPRPPADPVAGSVAAEATLRTARLAGRSSTEDRGQLAQALRRYAAQPVEVVYRAAPSPRYWVSQDIDGEAWWIVVLVGEPPPAPGSVPWSALSGVLLLLLVAAVMYAATIARPVRELAQATRRVGATWPEPVPLRGPRELRELAASFNGMLERLRQVEEERHVLLGGLPHDLRAPLARLRLRLAMLPPGADVEGLGGDLGSIERIVRQFNDFLQGGAGPEAARIAIGEIVEQSIAPHRSLGRDVAATLPVDGGPRVPPLALRRVLDNLVDNAFRHGRAPVRVLAREDGDELVVEVTDAGPGIPAAAGGAALAPFTKLDPSRGRGGCGLGLAIVRQIVGGLGGEVELGGAPGAFTVRVRLRDLDELECSDGEGRQVAGG